MSDTSGIGSQPPKIPSSGTSLETSSKTEAPIEQKGEYDNQAVTEHSPNGSKLDRTPSQAPAKSLQNRTVQTHTQTHTIQSHDLNTIRHLAGEGKWQGVASAIKLHVKTLEQLEQVLSALKPVGKLPPEAQDVICEHFGQLQATRVANIFASQLPDDPSDSLSTLMVLANNPHDHNSPIGSVSRIVTDNFIQKHALNDADRQRAVLNTCEKTYQIASRGIDELVAQLRATANENLNKQLSEYQNERAIEDNYRREMMSKA